MARKETLQRRKMKEKEPRIVYPSPEPKTKIYCYRLRVCQRCGALHWYRKTGGEAIYWCRPSPQEEQEKLQPKLDFKTPQEGV